MTETAIGYVRLSQESDRSIDGQVEDIRSFCESEGLDLEHIYNDGQRSSGFDSSRPEYQAMLLDIEEQDIDAVVVRKRDRLSRDKRERATFLFDMEDYGVTVYSAADGDEIDLGEDDDEAWLMEMIRAYMDDAAKSKEIAAARREVDKRLENGYYQGRPPFGFQFDDDGKFLIPVREEFEQAIRIIRLRKHPAVSLSYRDISGIVGVSKNIAYAVTNDRRDRYLKYFGERCDWCDMPLLDWRKTPSDYNTLCAPCDGDACSLCGDSDVGSKEIVRHHTSYEEGLTIGICKSCHNKLHSDSSYPSALLPDQTREEAEESFYVETRTKSYPELWNQSA